MRLFIAINFSREIKEVMASVRDNLKAEALSGHFSLDENLHLTLVFLGECDVQQTRTLQAVVSETQFKEFTLLLDKVGYFTRNGGDTWWIGLKSNESLNRLQVTLTHQLGDGGFLLEERRYVPHVTIGREVRMRSGFVCPVLPQIGFSVTSIELMESERINGKLTYTPVASSSRK